MTTPLDAAKGEQILYYEKLGRYLEALKRFDWQGEYIDDGQRWRDWKEDLADLRSQQRELDPLGLNWNQHAPFNLKVNP